ncbi:hypothetical protein D5R81_13370 [Parashewanella spongiae]|uniref:Uncharacterized protein n=1 Tax=Parashewanella spongiae TaxID=342950 RepID=A0A3A6U1X9_9GAMM|nr:hypothetical protein [Parashewanella spongiae]MCL1078986.1 hypothetical protein [Parashewanella spongiae]RJY11321.1 hypothetical protein D5R81_13370 [Parashewanella spongiae]
MAYLAQNDASWMETQVPAMEPSLQMSAHDCHMMTMSDNNQTSCTDKNNCCDSDCSQDDVCQSNCSHCFAFSVSGAMMASIHWPAQTPTTVVNAPPLNHFYIITGFTELRPPIS